MMFNDDSELNMSKTNNKYANHSSSNEMKQRPTKKLLLPWWSKIVIHVFCNVVIITCAVFLIIYGVSYGDTICQKWLASLLVTLLASIVLWQPIQVMIIAIIRFRLRKAHVNNEAYNFENEHDHEDTAKPSLNKYYRPDHTTQV